MLTLAEILEQAKALPRNERKQLADLLLNTLDETSAIEADNQFTHQSTLDLIRCAYPNGIPIAHYMTLLSILQKDMSIRVLAQIVAELTYGTYSIYMGDIMNAQRYKPEPHLLKLVMDKLLKCGYEDWRNTDK